MGQNTVKIDDVSKQFARKIKKKLGASRIILFGSRARGDFFEYSDYDFIIISPAFDGVHWLERISCVVKQWDSDRSIDVLPYTESEFNIKKKWSSTIKSALKDGVLI
ncbi:MAG TPA: nucleotidyltransferase domain-containing protein [Candidatus Nanoarchaeia archaeon]|nr:nucleotidyltransferase domain-containing protein [Candidatus Nanoarchaeia archaeon]